MRERAAQHKFISQEYYPLASLKRVLLFHFAPRDVRVRRIWGENWQIPCVSYECYLVLLLRLYGFMYISLHFQNVSISCNVHF